MRMVRETKMLKITDGEAGYLAGIIDGEGSLYVRKEYEGSTHTVIRVRITDEKLSKWIHAKTGIGAVHSYQPNQRRKDGLAKKRVWEWAVLNRADVEAFLNKIEPWLIIKKESAYILKEVESLKLQGIFNGEPMRELKERLGKLAVK